MTLEELAASTLASKLHDAIIRSVELVLEPSLLTLLADVVNRPAHLPCGVTAATWKVVHKPQAGFGQARIYLDYRAQILQSDATHTQKDAAPVGTAPLSTRYATLSAAIKG
jgi:hypothetical protein